MNQAEQITKALSGIVDIQSYLVGMGQKGNSIGQRILKSDQFKEFKDGASTVTIDLNQREFKAAITATAAINDPLVTSMTPSIDPGVRRGLVVRDLLSTFPTVNGAIEMPVKSAATTGSPVAVSQNSAMGESAYTFTTTFQPVETLGHGIPVSKQIFEDAGTLDAFMQTELLHGLAVEEQDQLLNGNGSTPQLTGLITGATAYTVQSPALSNKADIIRDAIKQVEVADFAPTAIILNPVDWRSIEDHKASGSDDTYTAGAPRLMAGPSLWGLPVVVTNAIAAGTFLVGDFNRAAILFDRERPQVELAHHHETMFVKGMVYFRATQRLALVITNAAALVKGSL